MTEIAENKQSQELTTPIEPTAELPQPATSESMPEAAQAPSGPISSAAPCCPDVATFEGSTGARDTYFGFDDKTNSVENIGSDEYWVPPDKEKTLPRNKETRDGARWVSVGVGRETQVEINFDGNFTTGCLVNCTYEIEPQHIADVSSPQPTSSGAAFKIKGRAEGEASLKVMCNGELKGYFHIWCAFPVLLDLDVVNIVSPKSRGAHYSIEDLENVLNETFGQALIGFDILDLGTVDLALASPSPAPSKEVEENQYNKETGEFLAGRVTVSAIKTLADSALAADRSKPGLRDSAITLYFYLPRLVADDIEGICINQGKSTAFTFIDFTPQKMYSVAAHEIGHCLGLLHPAETNAAVSVQYPAHHLSTLNVPTAAMPATNTEPAIPAGKGGLKPNGENKNIMAADPLNLMGYWAFEDQARLLRYRQWINCLRKIRK